MLWGWCWLFLPCASLGTGCNLYSSCRCLCSVSTCALIISAPVHSGRSGQALPLLLTEGMGGESSGHVQLKTQLIVPGLVGLCCSWLHALTKETLKYSHVMFFSLLFQFEENFVETKEQLEKLIKGGDLLFQQVPMVEIDGMKMVQTRAILCYIAGKYNLYGKDLKERALIDMYVEGITDLMQMIMMFPFAPAEAKPKNLASIEEKATKRYFPVFEKILKQHGQDFLVGNRLSWADVQLLEAILAVEEKVPAVLSGFPQLQELKPWHYPAFSFKNQLDIIKN
uniref:Glutathione S-transferase n=1 Tax=Anas platyrhynchos platyrhynchos TaxID=8840 RepID=A0A493T4D4_ANAPP